MIKLAVVIAAALILTILMAPTGVDAAKKKQAAPAKGEACRAACERQLKANGTWSKLPYGTCRRRCGMPL